jgi:hypothetical protein
MQVGLCAQQGVSLRTAGKPGAGSGHVRRVPTSHPFFRFVEALGRAGITSGGSVETFCPDAPLTRGQMAVFLATALGLHFAP